MSVEDVISGRVNKFFPKGGVCRTIKEGKASTNNGVITVPVDTKIVVEYFNAFTNKILITIDGRIRGEVTYDYLMECVLPITVDTGRNIDAVYLMQKTRSVFDNEALFKLFVAALLFTVGFLIGMVL